MGKDVYLFGGCTSAVGLSTCDRSVLRRDAQGQWDHVTDMPDGAVALSAIAELDGYVYLFGGCIASNTGGVDNQASAYSYDPTKNIWKRLNPLPAAVRSASAIPLDGRRILIVGGYGDLTAAHGAGSGFSRNVWIYEVTSDTYKQAPAFPFGISGIGLVRYENGIVGVGGENKMRGRSLRVVHGHFNN